MLKQLRIAILGMAVAGVQSLQAQTGPVFCPQNFRLAVSQMMPSAYPSRTVSYGYSVAVRNDSAFVYLPYMGRVYRPVMNDDGLNFALPVEKFNVEDKGKGTRRIAFSVRKQAVRYDFVLTVYANGTADIFLRPDNAQSISYMADVSDWKEQKDHDE